MQVRPSRRRNDLLGTTLGARVPIGECLSASAHGPTRKDVSKHGFPGDLGADLLSSDPQSTRLELRHAFSRSKGVR